jgi:predicted NAD/FAD-binding protein
MVSAVWSADERISRDYPAGYLFRFLHNHGLLGISGSPRWKTVTGGADSYVRRTAERLSAVRVSTPVRAVRRHLDGVELADASGVVHTVARVVIATHADQALAMLADADAEETEVLGAFEYSHNDTILHTDTSMLPRARGARASWNYLKPACQSDGRVVVSYDMNRLMRLSEPLDYVVTLNGGDVVDPGSTLRRMAYRHPRYTLKSVAAQKKLAQLTTSRVAFAGAYHGWGFHEDGCASGVRAAEAFGVTWA